MHVQVHVGICPCDCDLSQSPVMAAKHGAVPWISPGSPATSVPHGRRTGFHHSGEKNCWHQRDSWCSSDWWLYPSFIQVSFQFSLNIWSMQPESTRHHHARWAPPAIISWFISDFTYSYLITASYPSFLNQLTNSYIESLHRINLYMFKE